MKNYLILFDLDGVLLNSRKNMEYSWNSVQRKFDIKIEFSAYFALIGRPFQEILAMLGIEDSDLLIEEEYMSASKESSDMVTLFDGVQDALEYIKSSGYTLGIVTSKDSERTSLMLHNTGIFDFFKEDLIISPIKSWLGKPAPYHLMLAMALANIDPKNTIYVGDMQTDAESSIRAGCKHIHADWGYGHIDEDYENRVWYALHPKDLITTVRLLCKK